MRTITDHIVPEDLPQNQLAISVEDEPGAGGANHRYAIDGFDATDNPSNADREEDTRGPQRVTILFQNGPIKEAGLNGVTQETLLAIVIDRLRSFQAGPFPSEHNEQALRHCEAALYRLQQRTRERIARGVEGTTAT